MIFLKVVTFKSLKYYTWLTVYISNSEEIVPSIFLKELTIYSSVQWFEKEQKIQVKYLQFWGCSCSINFL